MRGWCDLWCHFVGPVGVFLDLQQCSRKSFSAQHAYSLVSALRSKKKKALVTDHDLSSWSSGHLLIRCAIWCAYSTGDKADGKSVCASTRPVCSRERSCSTLQCQEIEGFTGDTVCYTENKFLSSRCDQITVAFLQVTLEPIHCVNKWITYFSTTYVVEDADMLSSKFYSVWWGKFVFTMSVLYKDCVGRKPLLYLWPIFHISISIVFEWAYPGKYFYPVNLPYAISSSVTKLS